MEPNAARNIVVFGGSAFGADHQTYLFAETLGRRVAEAGWRVVTGGYGGVMEAASLGATSAGGEAVGVLCEQFGREGNRHLTERIMTQNLYERLQRIIELGDAYAALPGSTGTLVELAMVWELMNKKLIAQRPFFYLTPFWKPVVSVFAADTTRDPRFLSGNLPAHKGELLTPVGSPEEIVQALRTA